MEIFKKYFKISRTQKIVKQNINYVMIMNETNYNDAVAGKKVF